MYALDDVTIEFTCPRCGFYSDASIRQVRLRDCIICRGCKCTLQLEDHMNQVRLAEKKMRRGLQGLARQLGDIVIEL